VEFNRLLLISGCQLAMRILLTVVCVFCGGDLSGQDSDDARSGLVAAFRDANRTVHRIDERLSFVWGSGTPDIRVQRNFFGEWTGDLLVRSPGKHRFCVQLAGSLTIRVDNVEVFSGSGEDVFLSGEFVNLSGGDHKIVVEYRPVAGVAEVATPRFQIFWSGEDFSLEPIPADCLSHTVQGEGVESVQANSGDRGRMLVDALRCGACHSGVGDMSVLAAPDLVSSVKWLTDGDLRARLLAGETNHAMPDFSLSEQQSTDVIAFLRFVAEPSTARTSGALKMGAEDAEAGEHLLLTLGCAACHVVHSEIGKRDTVSGYYGGPSLWKMKTNRSAEWLYEWLAEPGKLNAAHRMPVFQLSDDERRQLVAALRLRSSDPVVPTEPRESVLAGDPVRGRKIVGAMRCGSCHTIPGVEATPRLPFPASAVESGKSDDWSCVASLEGEAGHVRENQPRYALSEGDSVAVASWLGSLHVPAIVADQFHASQVILRRNGCLSCHDRDRGEGLSAVASSIELLREDLRGQSQGLIPPSLTAVGDRLRDEVLAEALVGGAKVRRLPWLLVRMPRFSMKAEEVEALALRLIAEDRIPDSADLVRADLFEHMNPHHPSVASPAELLEGNQLAGAAGFNCISCHRAGTFEPRNVALGTRGSDLMLMGQRLRSRYFMRWMQNPIRVVSGIEMPAIRKAVDRDPEQSLSEQIAVLWKALSDPGFVPPTVASRYEQVVSVKPGGRPRVIRDVFLSEGGVAEEATARAFAAGFGNGHSVLFDLDQGKLIRWTTGEFARQRTEGKSWFWSLAGLPVSELRTVGPEIRLINENGQDAGMPLLIDEQRTAEVLSWDTGRKSVSLRLRWHFGTPPAEAFEEVSPHSGETTWSRAASSERVTVSILLAEEEPVEGKAGVRLEYFLEECPAGMAVEFPGWQDGTTRGRIPGEIQTLSAERSERGSIILRPGQRVVRRLISLASPRGSDIPVVPPGLSHREEITAVPGFRGRRIGLPTGIMPTAMAWRNDGRLAVTSLKGHVWLIDDEDGDGELDHVGVFAEGLAAPYGILAEGNDVLVSHKPEVIRLRDTDGDLQADKFEVVASGWGYSEDYHDWTAGLTRDSEGNLYVGLGSDYSQTRRSKANDRWRGTVLKIGTDGRVFPLAYSMRFPMGLAFDGKKRLYATDNQGVQNTFNEINHVIPGKHYGVPSRHDTLAGVESESPALMIPHPWTRSVNSLTFFPEDYLVREFAGHGIGCEYDTQCLIRFTMQEVSGVMQGACYRFSRLPESGQLSQFTGPVSCGVGPDGSLYIGSLRDSGWQGAGNTGCLEKISPYGKLPNGIREIRATKAGFEVEFLKSLPVGICEKPGDWDIQSLTRVWKGSYSTPDSDRHREEISALAVSADRKTVTLTTGGHLSDHLYEIRAGIGREDELKFWPAEGFYSMKRVPE